jgi:hypothetical protein
MKQMSNERRKQRAWPLWLFLPGGAVALLVGYVALNPLWYPDLPNIEIEQAIWTTYTHPDLKYSIDYPDALVVAQDGGEVTFSSHGTPIVWISHLTIAEADRRGRWADHEPVANIRMAGVAGKRYIYNHFDVGEGVETQAWVIPYAEKFLAFEFRTRRVSCLEELGLVSAPRSSSHNIDAIATRMVQSVRLASD